MMICQGCQKESHQIHGYCDEKGFYREVCADPECGALYSSAASIPDVFWNGKPYYSEALECEFTSRSQKARVMKERGVSELGTQKLGQKNWVEGSRQARRKEFDRERPMIQEALRSWKQTGYARGKVR